MAEIKDLYTEIDYCFFSISRLLEDVTEENMDKQIIEINEKITRVIQLKKNMIDEYGSDALKEFEKVFLDKIKEINIKYDNIINNMKSESEAISKELQNMENKKKVASYFK